MKITVNNEVYNLKFYHERLYTPTIKTIETKSKPIYQIREVLERKGGSTVCKLWKGNQLLSVGFTNCSKNDSYNKKIGRGLSFLNTIERLVTTSDLIKNLEIEYLKLENIKDFNFYHNNVLTEDQLIEVVNKSKTKSISLIVDNIKEMYPGYTFESQTLQNLINWNSEASLERGKL